MTPLTLKLFARPGKGISIWDLPLLITVSKRKIIQLYSCMAPLVVRKKDHKNTK